MSAAAGALVRRAGHAVVGLGTLALGASYVGVALVGVLAGALVAGPAVLLVVLSAGAVGWTVARSVQRLADSLRDEAEVTPSPPSRSLPAATAIALFVPFCTGVRELGAVGAYLLLAHVGLLSVHGTLWLSRLDPGTGPARAGTSRPVEQEVAVQEAVQEAVTCPPRELLRALPLDDLAAEWRATGEQVHHSTAARRHAVVQWREAVLEEIRRRDPAGFDRWLFTGAVDAPDRHLRAVADDTAPSPDESAR